MRRGLHAMLELYGTAGCHLCDDAKSLLSGMGRDVFYIDIADDEEAFERYALRIPLLRRRDNGAELGWPFDAVAVARFIS